MRLEKRILGDLEDHFRKCAGFEFMAKTEDHGIGSAGVVLYVCCRCKKPVVRVLRANEKCQTTIGS
jgi:hypothetical protein